MALLFARLSLLVSRALARSLPSPVRALVLGQPARHGQHKPPVRGRGVGPCVAKGLTQARLKKEPFCAVRQWLSLLSGDGHHIAPFWMDHLRRGKCDIPTSRPLPRMTHIKPLH